MPNIRDKQMRSVYSNWEQQAQLKPDFKVDGQGMIKMLVAIGDRWFQNDAKLSESLSKPGISRDEQLQIVKGGMDRREKMDLIKILDDGDVQMTDDVRQFLNQVIGRQDVEPNDGALHILGDQANSVLKGRAAAGSSIEVINLSTAPNMRLHTDDTFVVAKADSSGQFSGKMPDVQEGDLIRLRTRDRQGNVSNWIDMQAHGLGAADTRNAEVALHRIGLSAQGNGKIDLVNINTSRQISEPGATVRFVNTRTQQESSFVMNGEGTFDGASTLPGIEGDVFSVRVSDGRNNTGFSAEVGKVTVPGVDEQNHGIDLPDPKLHRDECRADGTPKFHTKRFSGPLFVNGAKFDDVKQGSIGDCYLPSAAASLAFARPGLMQDIIKQNDDGSYTVTFKERNGWGGEFKDKKITVDGDLYSRSWGGPLYGSSNGTTQTDKMEMWWPVFEKAYAQWKGSYNVIGDGGRSGNVFREVMGRNTDDMNISGNSPSKVWNKVKHAIDNKLPISAGTHGDDDSALYTNTGVYADHSYSVLGYKEENGDKFVKLRNPWGESEPQPGDGKNDGVFFLKLDDFMKLYGEIYCVKS